MAAALSALPAAAPGFCGQSRQKLPGARKACRRPLQTEFHKPLIYNDLLRKGHWPAGCRKTLALCRFREFSSAEYSVRRNRRGFVLPVIAGAAFPAQPGYGFAAVCGLARCQRVSTREPDPLAGQSATSFATDIKPGGCEWQFQYRAGHKYEFRRCERDRAAREPGPRFVSLNTVKRHSGEWYETRCNSRRHERQDNTEQSHGQ